MIAEIGDRTAEGADAVPERVTDMRDRPTHDVDLGARCRHLEHGLPAVDKVDIARQHRKLDWKKRWTDGASEHRSQSRVAFLARAVHSDVGTFLQQRRKERQPLDVVPVQVTQQAGANKSGSRLKGVAEIAKSGSEVEQDRIDTIDVKRYARGVAAVPDKLGRVTGR